MILKKGRRVRKVYGGGRVMWEARTADSGEQGLGKSRRTGMRGKGRE